MNADKEPMDGKTAQEAFMMIMEDYNSGNTERRGKAIERADALLDRYVWSIVNDKYGSYGNHREDMHSEGRLGWIAAMSGYDPAISAPTTYFYFYITHAIQVYLEANALRMTTYYSANAKVLKKIINDLEASGTTYDECLLAEISHLPLETVKNTLHSMNCSVSVSLGPAVESKISDVYEPPEAKVLREETEAELDKMLADLSPTDTEIFFKLNGIDGEKLTAKEIARRLSSLSKESREKYGVTAELSDDWKKDEKVSQYATLLENYCPEQVSVFLKSVNLAATASAKTAAEAEKLFISGLKDNCPEEKTEQLCAILKSEHLIRQRMKVVTKTAVNAINKRVVRQLRSKQAVVERDIAVSCDIDEMNIDDIHEQMGYMEQVSIDELRTE